MGKDLTKVQTLGWLSLLLFNRQRREGAFLEGDQIILTKTEDKRWNVRVVRTKPASEDYQK